MFIKVY